MCSELLDARGAHIYCMGLMCIGQFQIHLCTEVCIRCDALFMKLEVGGHPVPRPVVERRLVPRAPKFLCKTRGPKLCRVL